MLEKASQDFASWNRIGEWLRRLDLLRCAPRARGNFCPGSCAFDRLHSNDRDLTGTLLEERLAALATAVKGTPIRATLQVTTN